MKKILLVALCCLCFCGCGEKKEEEIITICDYGISKETIISSNNKIKNIILYGTIPFDTLNEAIEHEENLKKGEQAKYFNITRENKIVYIEANYDFEAYLKFASSNPNLNSNTTYQEFIKSREDDGINCNQQ